MLQKRNFLEIKERIDFLSVLFSAPNEFLFGTISDNSLVTVLEEVFSNSDFSVLEKSLADSDAIAKIKRDWLYLYVGVSGPLATPYASSYYRSTHRLMDKPAKDILALNQRWGIEIEDSYVDMPDHLSSIIQTLSILLEIVIYDERDLIVSEAAADVYILSTDTLKWLGRLNIKTKENETITFYSKIVELIIESLENLKKECELILQ